MVAATYDPIIFGKRLRNLRKAHHMTQQELAEYLLVSPDSISGYENGRITLAHEYIMKLCCKFNVSADYFYFGYNRQMEQETETVEENFYQLLQGKDAKDKEHAFQIMKMIFEMKNL